MLLVLVSNTQTTRNPFYVKRKTDRTYFLNIVPPECTLAQCQNFWNYKINKKSKHASAVMSQINICIAVWKYINNLKLLIERYIIIFGLYCTLPYSLYSPNVLCFDGILFEWIIVVNQDGGADFNIWLILGEWVCIINKIMLFSVMWVSLRQHFSKCKE